MPPRKRLLLTVTVAALVALPAAVLAGLCLGNACRRADPAPAEVPFCSLPAELRALIAAGFYDGRSPRVLAVTGEQRVIGGSADTHLLWPSLREAEPVDVPLVFTGTGVSQGVEVPSGTTLDAVAPTLAEIIGLRRPHPGVRSGESVEGLADGQVPRLAVLVVWKNVSSRDLERRPERWPVLRGLIEDGAATLGATPGSLPTDPAAVLTTIGTGSLPRDHGIIGSFVRNERGRAVEAWGKAAPFSVVATLGDDLDEVRDQIPRIGLVGTDLTDLGLIGGSWYLGHDRDDVILAARVPKPSASSSGSPSLASQATEAERLLGSGYGSDAMTDLLGVALDGHSVKALDHALGRILLAAERASDGSFVMAVTSTGGIRQLDDGLPAGALAGRVVNSLGAPAIEAIAAGGLFLDEDVLARTGVSQEAVLAELRRLETPEGRRVFADVFPAIAVTFARYC